MILYFPGNVNWQYLFFLSKISLIAMLINVEIKYRNSCMEPLLLNLHTLSLSNMVSAAQQSLGAIENI
jgi:uncharacterized membrane protein